MSFRKREGNDPTDAFLMLQQRLPRSGWRCVFAHRTSVAPTTSFIRATTVSFPRIIRAPQSRLVTT